jgi:hypothetical protein
MKNACLEELPETCVLHPISNPYYGWIVSSRGEASSVNPFSSRTAWVSVSLLSNLRKFYRTNHDICPLLFHCLVIAR